MVPHQLSGVSESANRDLTPMNLTLWPLHSDPRSPVNINPQASMLTHSSPIFDLESLHKGTPIDTGPGVPPNVPDDRIKPPQACQELINPESFNCVTDETNQEPFALLSQWPSTMTTATTSISMPSSVPTLDIAIPPSNPITASMSVSTTSSMPELSIDIPTGSSPTMDVSMTSTVPALSIAIPPDDIPMATDFPTTPAMSALSIVIPPSTMPTSTMSNSTTPSVPELSIDIPANDLPAKSFLESLPKVEPTLHLPQTYNDHQSELSEDLNDSELDQFQPVAIDQLIAKTRLDKELEVEKIKLKYLRKEIEIYVQYIEKKISPEETEQQLRNEVCKLQLECDKLAAQVNQISNHPVSLGKNNEEFYQSTYTEQQNVPMSLSEVTDTPCRMSIDDFALTKNDIQEKPDGSSSVCETCIFDNHLLLNKCEQCNVRNNIENDALDVKHRTTNQPQMSG